MKVLSICLLKRLVAETDWFISDWQAGFRGGRGCRDNILLLRVIYDNIIVNNKNCVVTYIDFAVAFDSVSHKFLDEALAKAGAKCKTRAMLRAIYAAAQGAAQVRSDNGAFHMSQAFEVSRGVIQGDIISPILFIIALLDQLVQEKDAVGQGVRVGKIKELKVLGYADDVAMAAEIVQDMTNRLTKFADNAMQRADMQVKLAKTFTHHVGTQEATTPATAAEIKEKEATYEFPCHFAEDGCTARFKTRAGMWTHATTCQFNYVNTSEYFEVEKILAVYGKSTRKLFLVSWKGYPDSANSWLPERSLLRDGCKESIDEF